MQSAVLPLIIYLRRSKVIKEKRPWPKDYSKGKCLKCKKEVVCNIPFIAGNISGYKSAEHECGKEYVHYNVCFTDSEMEEIGFKGR